MHNAPMQYAVCSECIFAYVWGWGSVERNSGEAYLGRFSGHRPYRQFSLISPGTLINRLWNLEDVHCLENALRYYVFIHLHCVEK
jgi:hypothetical protein